MKLNTPKDRPTQIGWALGIFFSWLMVFWWMSSLFPGREFSFEGIVVKLIASVLTIGISLYLMHINYD